MNTIDTKMKKILPFVDKEFFGYPLKNVSKETINRYSEELNKAPKEYGDFLYKYGSGELSSFFWIGDDLKDYQEIYGRPIEELEGMLVFASDLGEYVYAFDTKNNWEVVDIDASGNIFERYGNFETFINQMLDEIIEVYEEDKEQNNKTK